MRRLLYGCAMNQLEAYTSPRLLLISAMAQEPNVPVAWNGGMRRLQLASQSLSCQSP
jgi:hypothetical protein